MRSGSPHRPRLSPIAHAGTLRLPLLYFCRRARLCLPAQRLLRVIPLDHCRQLRTHIPPFPIGQLPQLRHYRLIQTVRPPDLRHRPLFSIECVSLTGESIIP